MNNTVWFGKWRQLRKHLYAFFQSVLLLALSLGIQAHNVGSRSAQDTTANSVELEKVIITSHTKDSFLPISSLTKKDIISKGGLMKMACCNLSESFENNASVTVGFTDAVSGARQIQLLGLSSIYSQILSEKRNSKYFDIYLGVENILAYTQRAPVREWETPFGRDFDASMIWDSLWGRRIYAGVRVRISEIK
jgi:hypothetical protein